MTEGIDTWLEEGLRFYSQGDPSRALEAWYRILDVDPAHSLAQQYVAYVRQVYRLGDANPARDTAPATAGNQQTSTLSRGVAMPNPGVPAAESLPPTEDLKKSIIGLDPNTSSWGDVVDSAFDVTPPKGQAPSPSTAEGAAAAAAAPATPAKMAPGNPWAAPVRTNPSAVAMPPPTLNGSASPVAGSPPTSPTPSASASASASSSAELPPWPPPAALPHTPTPAPSSPWSTSALAPTTPPAPAAPGRAPTPAAATSPWPAPNASTTVPSLNKTSGAISAPSMPPPSSMAGASEPELPLLEPVRAAVPASATGASATGASATGGAVATTAPPASDSQRTLSKSEVARSANSALSTGNSGPMPASPAPRPTAGPGGPLTPAGDRGAGFDPWRGDTIPPVLQPDPEAAAAAASAFDLAPTPPPTEVPPHVKPQPQPELGVEVDIDFGPPAGVHQEPIPTPPPMMAPPTSTTSPPAWRASAVDEVGLGGGLRKVGGEKRVDVSDNKPLTPSEPMARGGVVEERVAKPSRRFGETWDTPSSPSPPSPSSSSPLAPPSGASMSGGSAASASSAPPSAAAAMAALGVLPGSSSSGAAAAMAAAAIPLSTSSHAGRANGDGANVVVDPWDEMGGPGSALDLDKAIPTPSPFQALVSTPTPAMAQAQPVVEEPDQCTQLMKGARELFELGDFSGSLDLVEKVLKIDSENDSARAYMKRNEATLIKMYESKLGDMRRQPRQLMPPDEVIWMNMHHKAGFLLAQVDGSLSFEDLLEVSGMTRFDTMRILADLVQQGIIGG